MERNRRQRREGRMRPVRTCGPCSSTSQSIDAECHTQTNTHAIHSTNNNVAYLQLVALHGCLGVDNNAHEGSARHVLPHGLPRVLVADVCVTEPAVVSANIRKGFEGVRVVPLQSKAHHSSYLRWYTGTKAISQGTPQAILQAAFFHYGTHTRVPAANGAVRSSLFEQLSQVLHVHRRLWVHGSRVRPSLARHRKCILHDQRVNRVSWVTVQQAHDLQKRKATFVGFCAYGSYIAGARARGAGGGQVGCARNMSAELSSVKARRQQGD